MRKVTSLLILFCLSILFLIFFIVPSQIKASGQTECVEWSVACDAATINPITNECTRWISTCIDYGPNGEAGTQQNCPAGYYGCNNGCCPIGNGGGSTGGGGCSSCVKNCPAARRQGDCGTGSKGEPKYTCKCASAPPPPPPPPLPSCTVTLTPNPGVVPEAGTIPYIATVTPKNGSVTKVNFTLNDNSIATLSPASDSTKPYNTTVTGVSDGTTIIRAGVIMSGNELCFKSAPLLVTPSSPWWQAKNADVVTSGDLISSIPSTLSDFFILQGGGGFPGVAIYGGSVADFQSGNGTGSVSSTGWLGNSTTVSQKVYSYKYFENLLPTDILLGMHEITSPNITASDLTSGLTVRGYYWNHYDGTTGSTLNQNLTITSALNLGTNKVVLLVKGADLNIGGDITLQEGKGFFTALVGQNDSLEKGDIVINPSVTQLEGIYFADSYFKTGSAGKNLDSQLTIRGAVAANLGINLERDLVDNTSTPAEFFEYGLDQMLLYPPSLSVRKIKWQEIAP